MLRNEQPRNRPAAPPNEMTKKSKLNKMSRFMRDLLINVRIAKKRFST